MSLQFVFGPSGSGKSKYLQETLVKEALLSPKKKFLLIVPDQYNMKTQKDMILLHPDQAFSNIEVLSFSRLAHRILEEVGGEEIPVLDDTGKSLIIRLVSESMRDELSFIGNKLDKIGYIHEVKSAISEFMQYAVSPEDVLKLSLESNKRPLLSNKLDDIQKIYQGFIKFKEDKFITKEETLDVVRRGLHKSELVKNSIIIFDGFTGFTPIQESLIQELMLLTDKMIISLNMEVEDDPYHINGEQELFLLSKNTVSRIKRLADEASVTEIDPVFLQRDNMKSYKSAEIAHLEENIFRFPFKTYKDEINHLHVYQAQNMREEVCDTCQRIRTLTDVSKLQYRDVAVVCGDLGGYADLVSETFALFGIPVFMDYSKSVMQTAFIESLCLIWDVLEYDFSAEAVMRYLRCGFSPLDREACDELENFLLRTGIRGIKKYSYTWTLNNKKKEQTDAEIEDSVKKTEQINLYRQTFLAHVKPLLELKEESSVEDICRALYEFMSSGAMQKKLSERAAVFEKNGDLVRASEYRQIYAKVIDLLDQMVSLIGKEVMSLSEFKEILKAGFAEIKLGTIPQETDTVIVSDMERSRLTDIKALFFIGVNDSNIPGNVNGGGIISDIDREFIADAGVTLAPTPKEQIYIQRLYLYMILSKPLDEIYLSYASVDGDGKSMRPAYLINMICKLFPNLKCQPSYISHSIDGVVMPAGTAMIKENYAALMRDYSRGKLAPEDKKKALGIGNVLSAHGMEGIRKSIEDVAFEHFDNTLLSPEIIDALYGRVLQTSISRLEKFASCAYAHFLSYGMALKEREEFGFEKNDMGDVYHKVLEQFAQKIKEQGINWSECPEEVSNGLVDELLENIAATYGDTVLVSSARRGALTKRMNRILKRTIDTIKYQLSQGSFIPEEFEQTFFEKRKITDRTGKEVGINITGKIDRIDLFEKDGRLYIKIIDYKSGNRDFDLTSVYHGLQLQLSVYMKQAMEFNKKKYHKDDVYPSGMLYYHISDPVIDADDETSEEDITSKLLKELKLKGVVNSDRVNIGLLDHLLAGTGSATSNIIPVAITAKDEISSKSKVLSYEDFLSVCEFADHKLENIVGQIYEGKAGTVPCSMEKAYSPCQYCDYKSICKIESGISGYETKTYPKEDEEAVLEKIRNGIYD